MVTQSRRTPADVLRESRTARSLEKRRAVYRTVDSMKREGITITFAAVARAASVSTWLVYAAGIREYIDEARKAQMAEPATDRRLGRQATAASLNTDLQLARQQNKKLRGEINRLRDLLRERLGDVLDDTATVSLRNRIDELLAANETYRSQNSCLTTELAEAQSNLLAAEDDLAGCRESLRRMIRAQSAGLDAIQ